MALFKVSIKRSFVESFIVDAEDEDQALHGDLPYVDYYADAVDTTPEEQWVERMEDDGDLCDQ